MTCDELALLRAVLENPADDLPRLVYADWLEEHAGTVRCPACRGDTRHRLKVSNKPERYMLNMVPGTCSTCGGLGSLPDGRKDRAEFVRVQVEIAKLDTELMSGEDCSHPTCPGCVERRALRRRERELWPMGRRVREWFGPHLVDVYQNTPDIPVPEPCGVVRRGFISSVACPAAAWLEHGDDILKAHPVVRVRLTDTPTLEQIQAGDFYRDKDEWGEPMRSRRWPGVTFELPEVPYGALNFMTRANGVANPDAELHIGLSDGPADS